MTENTTIQISDDMKAKASLYAKMARVMAAMNRLPKDGTNDYFKYKFVEAGAVADAVRSALAEQNVAFFAEMTGYKERDGVLVARFNMTFADGDTGATAQRVWFGEAKSRDGKGGRDDKAINKAATAAQKYFLLKTFMISTGDEPDADQDGPAEKPKAAKSGREHEPGYATRKVIPTPLNNARSIEQRTRVFETQTVNVVEKKDNKKRLEYVGNGITAVDFTRTALREAGFADDELPSEKPDTYTLKYPVEVTAIETEYASGDGTYWKVAGLKIKMPDITPEAEAKTESKRKAS